MRGSYMKKTLILILLILPRFCFPTEVSKEDSCGSDTFYADMKGDGDKETIVLVNGKLTVQDDVCHFKSLTIYEKNKIVYEEKIKPEDVQNMESREISIERFHIGSKEMIFYGQHYCSNCNDGIVLGFIGGKYQEVRFRANRGVQVIDLDGDGNNEIVADPEGYYEEMPSIFDYDPIKDEFTSSEKKHPKFYQNLIKDCEAHLAEFSEEGDECCNRTANLAQIASAAAILGDDDLHKKTMARLSTVYVDIGKYYYSKNKIDEAIREYQIAINKNGRNYEALNYLGYSYFRRHKFKEAVDSLLNSISINPSYVEGHYNLALAYWSDGKKTKAINEIKSVLKLDPKYKDQIKDDTQFKVFKSSKEFRALILQ
jgi:tetratricopeptide (TPR) repeat protein